MAHDESVVSISFSILPRKVREREKRLKNNKSCPVRRCCPACSRIITQGLTQQHAQLIFQFSLIYFRHYLAIRELSEDVKRARIGELVKVVCLVTTWPWGETLRHWGEPLPCEKTGHFFFYNRLMMMMTTDDETFTLFWPFPHE